MKQKSKGLKANHLKKMKETFKKKELRNELAWWLLLGCTAFLTGVVIRLIIG